MQSGEIIDKLREYNKSLSKLKLTQMERAFVDEVEERSYLYRFYLPDIRIPDTLEELRKEQKEFKSLLPMQYTKVCEYLTHIQEYTCIPS